MSIERIPDDIQRRFAGDWIRGPRISRLEESSLGYFRLSPETAWDVGKSNLGVFAGTSLSLEGTLVRLKRLEESTPKCRWVVVADSKETAAQIIRLWFGDERVTPAKVNLPRAQANIVVALPESLRRIESPQRENIGGVILVDMQCHIHCLRSGVRRGNFIVPNDRPQLVANFRNSLAVDNWLPPLFLLTESPAKSVGTDAVARAYCLDGWWFIDGRSLKCGASPIVNGNDA